MDTVQLSQSKFGFCTNVKPLFRCLTSGWTNKAIRSYPTGTNSRKSRRIQYYFGFRARAPRAINAHLTWRTSTDRLRPMVLNITTVTMSQLIYG